MKASAPALALLAVTALIGCSEVTPTTLPMSVLSAPILAPSEFSETICSGSQTEVFYDGAFRSGTEFVFLDQDQLPNKEGEYAAPIGDGAWIGPVPINPEVGAQFVIDHGTYEFQTKFSLPLGARGEKLSGSVHADDRAIFSLNGVEFFRQGLDFYPNHDEPAETFSVQSGFLPGENTVTIDLVNTYPFWAPESTGPDAAALTFCYTVTASFSSDDGGDDDGKCLPAPAVAAAILKDQGGKPNSKAGKNLISQVADHMTQGARFEGLEKCDEGYREAVEAFLDAL